eukprot:CAMPEP_0172550468 /NCGR_PEP_ID=MMETSP1067-20121228/29990_1 /TAXON_ID=265564 ORGANISM="Thalassiosira punctigera, Strain Tpunct2005C2" /NCGR_SAMPLE_ID=MMETSP1067 /ASSEMBLY_ACC=CAM_ASM_000444 /LENGTH=34 /DNA_ID= /DNA_START= /DNA_END= /DNA_ORIENTATION=
MYDAAITNNEKMILRITTGGNDVYVSFNHDALHN